MEGADQRSGIAGRLERAVWSLSTIAEEKYVSYDLEVVAPTVKELISAFSLNLDVTWTPLKSGLAMGEVRPQDSKRTFCSEVV